MRKLVTGIAASAGSFGIGLVGTASATPPGFIPPPIPAYCHGYDVSTFATEFGGVKPGLLAEGQGYSVQSAQQADRVYCRTGVLLP